MRAVQCAEGVSSSVLATVRHYLRCTASDALELLYVITPHKDIINDTTWGTIQMPRRRKPEKKQIDQYDHKDTSRTNNPPVGLVTPETDRDAGKKTYAYDPHIDPSLQFDSERTQIIEVG